MIHIATVHWKSDRWIQIQAEFLRRYLHNDFRVYAWLNDIPNAPVDSFYYHTSEPLKSHAVSTGGANDLLSRVGSLIDDDSTHLADYTYLGLNQVVQVDSPQPN